MYPTAGFEFGHGEAERADLRLDDSLSTRENVFDAYAQALHFPEYFGRNWDAFIDCLSDLSWVDHEEVRVVHDALPALPHFELRSYLECLQDVIARIRPQDRPKPRFWFREMRSRTNGEFVSRGMRPQVVVVCRKGGTGYMGAARLAVDRSRHPTEGSVCPSWKGRNCCGCRTPEPRRRAGSWLAGLGHGGKAARNAAAAEAVILNILENGTATVSNHEVFGEVVQLRLADGAGAWSKTTGEFIGFLERYTPR